jgi:hypothetical protein
MMMQPFFGCLLAASLMATTTRALALLPAPAADTKFPFDVDILNKVNDGEAAFSIAPDELILRAKDIATIRGMGTKDGGACLADSFQFVAQFVQVDRKGYLGALESFNLEDSFAVAQNMFGWTVDPMQPNRVWFLNRQQATFSNGPFQGVAPSGETIVLPPQSYHLDFNEDGLVTEFGFYTVDRNQGTTGGLGGAFAFFYAVGKPLPFPEGKPYQRSWQRKVIEKIAPMLQKLAANKKQKG